MEINKAVSNIPFKTPAELDGQSRLQPAQQSGLSTTRQTYASGDTVSISAQSRALGSQSSSATNSAQTLQAPQRVTPERNTRNIEQNQQQTRTQQPQQQQLAAQTNAPPDRPDNQVATPGTTTSRNRTAQTAQTPESPQTTGPQPESAGTRRAETLRAPTTPPQSSAPQNYSTPLKPAQESPVTAASGLSSGRIPLNITV